MHATTMLVTIVRLRLRLPVAPPKIIPPTSPPAKSTNPDWFIAKTAMTRVSRPATRNRAAPA
jgi:hypothetical protein